ncbi:MAG: hypothetical protein QM767_27030 [Anaeromyxobacter sp.]
MEPTAKPPSQPQNAAQDHASEFARLVELLRKGQLEPPPSSEALGPLQQGDVEPWPAPGSARALELFGSAARPSRAARWPAWCWPAAQARASAAR